MVETTAVLTVVATATVGTYLRTGLFGILQLYATQSLVVTNGTVPVGAVFACATGVGAFHKPACAHATATVGIVVVCPRQGCGIHTAEIHGRHELRAGSDAVVHIGKKVITLIEAHGADVECEAECHQGMSLVAAALLHLSEIAKGTAAVLVNYRHEIADEFIATVV